VDQPPHRRKGREKNHSAENMIFINAGCNRSYRPPSTGGVEQARDGAVDLLVLTFAVMLEYDLSALVDDVLRRPILVCDRRSRSSSRCPARPDS
jgi:hypothetical protein